MKTIGLIGGMSWESSLEYYRIINETVNRRLGGLHSAKCVLVSVDFAEIEVLQSEGRWEEASRQMLAAARQVERAGADFVVICTNTMHKMAAEVQRGIGIPLLHIADPTAERVRAQKIQRIGLLGTRFTMEEDFYTGRLAQKYGLQVIIPEARERETVHRVIYDELVLGIIRASSKGEYLHIIDHLEEMGAEGVILGCTEIGLLIKETDTHLPLFDTTRIHAEAAVDWALAA